MKNLRIIAAAVLMLGFAAGSTHGQVATATTKMKVTVPFAFTIGRTSYSAGQYLITSSSDKVIVEEESGRNVALLLTSTLEGKLGEQNSKVIFVCYSGECFLSQIWFEGQEAGRTLNPSKRQLELASQFGGRQFALSGKQQ
jgi:hypothetical protein